jgi:lipid-A-disaccharide synthase-like uncharacterized protein
MGLHCTHCQSTDLSKVSLVYEQGRFGLKARTRFRGFLLGTDGPDLIAGFAHTTAVAQNTLSIKLRPPVKWSYRKVVGWFVFFSLVALVAFVQWVMSKSATTSSLPGTFYVLIASGLFFLLQFLTWRHNHVVYPRKYAEWDRSFLCQRCGTVSAD